MTSLDLDRATEMFAQASDGTVGVEEEFSILDPQTLELLPRFEQLREAAQSDPILHEHITGELISSEIEIISGVGADLHDALARQRERRRRLFAFAGPTVWCSAPPGLTPGRTIASSRSSTPSTTAASRRG